MLKRRSGLGSLIPGAELAPDGAIESAPLALIAVNPYQPRRVFAPEALEELAESIRRHGVLQPLTVRRREGGFELIAGERRLQAARKAGLAEVPVVIRGCTDQEMLALALVENLQREDLTPLEAARSYQQLIDEFGLSQGEVASLVGKSRPAVANTLRLLGLPARMQAALAEGTISEGHGRALLAVADPARREALFDEAVHRRLSVRELEARVAPAPAPRRTRRTAAHRPDDVELQMVAEELQRLLLTKVRIKPGSTLRAGVVEISYYSQEELDRLYEYLRYRQA